MKVAVTSTGPTPEYPVDKRFGRAPWFLVFTESSGAWEAVDNAGARSATQGAGIRAAQRLSELGVGALVTGVAGPKALRALAAGGIPAYHGAGGTAVSALRAWREGRLERAPEEVETGTP